MSILLTALVLLTILGFSTRQGFIGAVGFIGFILVLMNQFLGINFLSIIMGILS